MTEPMVDLEDLAFRYAPGTPPVLEGVTLSIPRGSFVAVVGPSGSGKSSLLRIIAGLLPPSAGTVRLHARPEPGRRPTALVFQDARLLPWRRVAANVAYGLEGLDLPPAARQARTAEALATVGLAAHATKWPHQLSGGQRQRVGIARALAVQPDLLLVDEPFGALDAITRATLQSELLRIWGETGATVLFVTHDLDEAVTLADRVVVLGGRPARIVREFTVDLPRPRNPAALESRTDAVRAALRETFTEGSGI